jgi:hypothetical protein
MAYGLGSSKVIEIEGARRLTRIVYGKNIRPACAALDLLFRLACRADGFGFALVHSAMVSVARTMGEASYGRLAWLISECEDLQAKTSSLQLINQLVVSAPDDTARQQLLLKLKRRLGFDLLLSAQLHLQDPAFQEQVQVYQQVANVRIPGSWEDANFYLFKSKRSAEELKEAHGRLNRPSGRSHGLVAARSV